MDFILKLLFCQLCQFSISLGMAAFIVYTIHTFQVRSLFYILTNILLVLTPLNHYRQIYNFWERKKTDYNKLENELNTIKTQIASDAWCKSVEANIKAKPKAGILKQELTKLNPSKASIDDLVVKHDDVKGGNPKNIRL